jgi:hypothetical protein
MSKQLRVRLSCLLALLVIVQNAGNCCGLVLCIEADGAASIETPAEQAACLARHEAVRESFGAQAGATLSTPPGCVDIPLCLTTNVVTARIDPVSVPRATAFHPAFILSAVPCVMHGGLPNFGRAEFYSSSPPSGAIVASRRVILLV